MFANHARRNARSRKANRSSYETLELRRMLHSGAVLPDGFTEVELSGEVSQPTAMAVAPDGRLFVTTARGHLWIFEDGMRLPTPSLSLTNVLDDGEHGLTSVELDPNFEQNNFLYVYYTVDGVSTEKHNRISRFTVDGNTISPASEFVLMDLELLGPAELHNGGGMAFGADGKLYVGVGDNNNHSLPQSLDSNLGKVLRLNSDGTIPEDNPYYLSTTGDNRAIWARGLRNPFTLDAQPGTGRIFINDVGAASFEEINEVAAEANFGWPVTEGVANSPSYDDPIYAYAHGSGDDQGCAITGGVFYNPGIEQFGPEFVGKYFYTDYCGGWIRILDPATGTTSEFATEIAGSPVDLEVDGNGSLFYLSRSEGKVFRIDNPGDFPPDIIVHPSDESVEINNSATFSVSAAGSQPFTYQWRRDGVAISGATSRDYTVDNISLSDDGASFSVVVSNAFGTSVSDFAILSVIDGVSPEASITSPTVGQRYDAGDTISFSGVGTDADDGNLPLSAYSWTVNFHHDNHFHPFITDLSGVSGGAFLIPTVGETSSNVWYRIHLTVTDSDGLTDTTFQDVYPNTSLMQFRSNIPGVDIQLDGTPRSVPLDVEGVVNVERELSVEPVQYVGEEIYQFVRWSDGGTATRSFSTPSNDTVFEALFGPRLIESTNDLYSEIGAGWVDGPILSGGEQTRRSTMPGASAIWTPFVKSGSFHVSYFNVADPSNTNNAEFRISHAGGVTTRHMDLSSEPEGWIYLGEFDFSGNGEEFLSVTNVASDGNINVYAAQFDDGTDVHEDLVFELTFDEQQGTTATDSASTGTVDVGTLIGPVSWSSSGEDGSIDLDEDGYVAIADSNDLNLSSRSQFTLSAWFNADDVDISSRKQVIYEHGGNSRGINMYVFDGRLYVGVWNNSPTFETFLSTGAIQSGTWHHVALTLDGGSTLQPNAIKGYLDGQEFGSGDGVIWRKNARDIGLGRSVDQTRFHDGNSSGSGNGFEGLIDNVRFHGRKLNPLQLQYFATANSAPLLSVDATQVVVPPDLGASNSGRITDVDFLDDEVTLTASVGTISRNGTDWTWHYPTPTAGVDDIVTITASDGSSETTLDFRLVFAGSTIIDNQDAEATMVGNWRLRDISKCLGSDCFHDRNQGKGFKSFTFTPNLNASAEYTVALQWHAGSTRATNVPVDIRHDGGLTTVFVDQTRNGGKFNNLGSFFFAAGTGSVTIRTDNTDGYVVADAVRFELIPQATPQVLIGDTSGFSHVTEGGAILETYEVSLSTVPSGPVVIQVNADPQTEVSLDGVNYATSQTLIFVNDLSQTVIVRALDDELEEEVQTSTIHHELISSDDPSYSPSLPIDDVLLQVVDNDGLLFQRIDNRDSNVTTIGNWRQQDLSRCFGDDCLNDRNRDKGTKSVTFNPAIASSGLYEVRLHWSSASNRADNVPVDIHHFHGVTTVEIDQTKNGGRFVSLGQFWFAAGAGALTIRTDGTSGYVTADAVEFQQVPLVAETGVMIDNSDDEFSIVGSWRTQNLPGCYGDDCVHDRDHGKGSKSATFAPVITESGLYEVALRWSSASNRATNVPVDVHHANGISTFVIDQTSGGGVFKPLGNFFLDAGTSQIVIRNEGTQGYVVADAVQLVRLVSESELTPQGSPLAQRVTYADGSDIVAVTSPHADLDLDKSEDGDFTESDGIDVAFAEYMMLPE